MACAVGRSGAAEKAERRRRSLPSRKSPPTRIHAPIHSPATQGDPPANALQYHSYSKDGKQLIKTKLLVDSLSRLGIPIRLSLEGSRGGKNKKRLDAENTCMPMPIHANSSPTHTKSVIPRYTRYSMNFKACRELTPAHCETRAQITVLYLESPSHCKLSQNSISYYTERREYCSQKGYLYLHLTDSGPLTSS